MELIESAIYCDRYAQLLPPEYHLYAWMLWFCGILLFMALMYSFATWQSKQDD